MRLLRRVLARALHNARLLHCSRLCGGAPAAWCLAKGSGGLMWVTPAAAGLWFISLGMETRTLHCLQDSQPCVRKLLILLRILNCSTVLLA